MMPKIDKKTNEMRGERVKQLLKGNKKSQRWLADRLFLKPEHLNMMLNGHRTLGEHTIQEIARLFPDIRIEWLLGLDPYMTAEDAEKGKALEPHLEKLHSEYEHIIGIMAVHGYTFEDVDVKTMDAVDKMLYPSGAIEIKKGKQSKMISHRQWRYIIYEISRFVEFEMSGLFGYRKEDDNG